MTSLFDFSRQIAQHTRAKKYDTALQCFKVGKSAYSNDQIGGNIYLVSDMLSCLRHTNNFDAAFKFLDIYNVKINEETEERLLTSYGWLLYSKYKAENSDGTIDTDNLNDEDYFKDEETDLAGNYHFNKTEVVRRIEKLIPLLSRFGTDFSYSVTSFLFSIVLKSEKKKPAPNWRLVNEFCNLFDPDGLKTECSTIEIVRKGQKKEMELASDRENWYAYKSKALMKLGEFQECFDISKRGLDAFEKFHYSNDVWFSRRIALSKKNLGNAEDTINELKAILRKKKEWFIQKELAELLFDAGQTKEAFSYAVQALNNFGDLEYKIDLLYLAGRILFEMSDEDMAFKHFSLSKLIRQKEQWRIPQKLNDELNKFKKPDIPAEDIGKLKAELKKYWNSFDKQQKSNKPSGGVLLKGKIKKILNDNEKGKNGFIEVDSKDYYFVVSANYHLAPIIEVGKLVDFKVEPSKDGNKEQARIIRIVEEGVV